MAVGAHDRTRNCAFGRYRVGSEISKETSTSCMNLRRSLKIIALALAVGPASSFASTPASSPLPTPALPAAFEDLDDVPLPDPDLWQRIRVGFALDALDSPLVAEHEEWYSSRPEYI